ncbi:FAD-dependent oxidoreductase [Kribbella deserti]|uniref:FAD-binding protein n=1 Tax=Kribbella deserti TaxID=1926257 RepID=A0ABV6QH21_9ACTN
MTPEPVNRRTLLKAGGALAALAAAGCTESPSGHASPSIAPIAPGGPDVAAAPDWAGFGRGLDGRFYRPGSSGYAGAHQLFNPRFDSVQPAGVVKAATIADIRESVAFARKNRLRCAPKAGGHSYVGASSVANGLVVDIGNLRSMSYANGVLTVGAGARLYDVHAFLDRYGRSLPTGTCPTVGVAGLALGGGMGVHTRAYGLTGDRILSMQVVTADGVFRACSPTQNADLFWALRGGGGGNLGIVTSFRLSTIPGGRLGIFVLKWTQAQAAAVIRGWQRFAREAPTTSWANLHLDARADGTIAVRAVGVSTTGSATAAAAQLESFVGARASSRTFSQRSHLEAVRFLGGGTTSPRTGFTAGSDVLRGPMDAATINGLVNTVKARARAGKTASAILDPLGGQAVKVPTGGSAWPWRSSLGVIQWYVGLAAHPTSTSYNSARAWITSGHRAVAKASAGGYVNYVEPGRAVQSYYSGSWNRLRTIKRKYDPANVFGGPYGIS